MSAAPPFFVGDVLGTIVDLKHLHKVRLGVKPGLFYDKLVNVILDLLVLQVVSVQEVKADNESEGFDSTGNTDTEPGWRDFDGSPDAPEHDKHHKEVEGDDGRAVRLNIIVLGIVLVDWEDPWRVINWPLVHVSSIRNPSSEDEQSENDTNHQQNDGDAGKI